MINFKIKTTLIFFSILIINNVLSQCISGDCLNGYGKFKYENGDWVEGYWKNGDFVKNAAGKISCEFYDIKRCSKEINQYHENLIVLIKPPIKNPANKIILDTFKIESSRTTIENCNCAFHKEFNKKTISTVQQLSNVPPKLDLFETQYPLMIQRIIFGEKKDDITHIFCIIKTDKPLKSLKIESSKKIFQFQLGNNQEVNTCKVNDDVLVVYNLNNQLYYIASKNNLKTKNETLTIDWGNGNKKVISTNRKTGKTLVNFDLKYRESESELKSKYNPIISSPNNISEIKYFLSQHRNYSFSETISQAELDLDSIEFKLIELSKDNMALLKFMTEHPNSKYLTQVTKKLEFLEDAKNNFSEISNSTPLSYCKIINDFPNTNESDFAFENLKKYYQYPNFLGDYHIFIDSIDVVYSRVRSNLKATQIEELNKSFTIGIYKLILSKYNPKTDLTQKIDILSKDWIDLINASQKKWFVVEVKNDNIWPINDSILSPVMNHYFKKLTICKTNQEQNSILDEVRTKFPNILYEGTPNTNQAYFEFILRNFNKGEGEILVFNSSYMYSYVINTGEFDVLIKLCEWTTLKNEDEDTIWCKSLMNVNFEKLQFKDGHFNGKQELYTNNEKFCEIIFPNNNDYNHIKELSLFEKNAKISTQYFNWLKEGYSDFKTYLYEYKNGVNITLADLDSKIKEGDKLLVSKKYSLAKEVYQDARTNNFPIDLKQNLLLDEKLLNVNQLINDSVNKALIFANDELDIIEFKENKNDDIVPNDISILETNKSTTPANLKSVKIGAQTWTTENLNVSTFRNGEAIPEAKTKNEWELAAEKKQPAWCYYNFDSKKGEKYGKLFNWYAVNDSRGLAPNGWHVASDEDWIKLETFIGEDFINKVKNQVEYQTIVKYVDVGGYDEEKWMPCENCSYWTDKQRENVPCTFCKNNKGKYIKTGKYIPKSKSRREEKIKLDTGWNGSNSSGLSILPGGECASYGYLENDYAVFWCSTGFDEKNAFYRAIGSNSDVLVNYIESKSKGYSVRCVKTELKVEINTNEGSLMIGRENQKYKTMKIGNTTWTVQNLNVSTFRNGDPIPQAKSEEEWKIAGIKKQPAWCYYNNDSNNGKSQGKLYNWYVVMDSRGIAPEGWRVPTEGDWEQLSSLLGGPKLAGIKMKSTKGWDPSEFYKTNGNGNNLSGFSGLPSGERDIDGKFDDNGLVGNWWSSSYGQIWTNDSHGRINGYLSKYFLISSGHDKLISLELGGGYGFSIRLIKN
jgi:uncharacterized protein (TIGR02145 family)